MPSLWFLSVVLEPSVNARKTRSKNLHEQAGWESGSDPGHGGQTCLGLNPLTVYPGQVFKIFLCPVFSWNILKQVSRIT